MRLSLIRAAGRQVMNEWGSRINYYFRNISVSEISGLLKMALTQQFLFSCLQQLGMATSRHRSAFAFHSTKVLYNSTPLHPASPLYNPPFAPRLVPL